MTADSKNVFAFVTNKSLIKNDKVSDKCNFHYFHMLFKTGYFLGVIPFKLVLRSETGHYRLQKGTRVRMVKSGTKLIKLHVIFCFT